MIVNILKDGDLELVGAIPEDRMIYEYDLNGRPTVKLPEDSDAIKAAYSIFDRIVH